MKSWAKCARQLRRAWLFIVLAVVAPALQAADGPPPVEDFFRHPAMTDAKMSPSGKLLGVLLAGASGRVVLGVVDLEGKEKPRVVGAFQDADVRSFHWVNDQRLVFDAIDLSTEGGLQHGAGLYAVGADGNGFRRLIRRQYIAGLTEGNSRIESRELEPNHYLLRTLRDGSDDIVVQRANYDNLDELESRSILRMNTVTGATSSLSLGAPAGARTWVVDAKGEPRAVTNRIDGTVRLYWRDTAAGTWKLLEEKPWHESFTDLWAVDSEGTLYVSAYRGDPAGTLALYRYNVSERRVEKDPLVALDAFDFDGSLIFDTGTRRLLGVHYQNDADGTQWFDPLWRKLQERVDKLLPSTVNSLSGECCVESQRVLVRAASDRQSPFYLLYDPKNDKLERIGAQRPWIDAKAMAERTFTRIKARDGLEIPVYITQPRGKGPFPAVVLVHGGPYVRGGNWEWDAQAQFLASRGYLVIEPEFRGSTGFGLRHFRAGLKQWGLAMQDDVADAALWAVEQKLADRSRICIAGASYGGYATLMGLVRHPELYRCGVNWVGVTDIELMYSIHWSDIPRMSKRYGMPHMIGDREKDAAQLAATSPLKQAAKITQPLLMAYGGSDRRVPIEHGTRFRDAVSKHNQNIEWIVYGDEGHGFLLVKNNVDFWTRVEKFLARHLQPSAATAAQPAKPPGS
jgi:dipeptidyl aminopeptidase/acylaminoacyl peptidase